MQPLADQMLVFFLVIILGNLVGIFFDFYRNMRRIWRLRHWGTILGDAFFWLFVTGFSFLFLLYSNWGEIRLYVFIALALGLFLYFNFLSRKVSFLMTKFFQYLRYIFVTVRKILRLFVQFVIMILSFPFKMVGFFVFFFIKSAQNVIKCVKKIIYKVFKKGPQEK